MLFEKSTKPEVVNVLCSNLARICFLLLKKEIFRFKNCRHVVGLLVFGRLIRLFIRVKRQLLCLCTWFCQTEHHFRQISEIFEVMVFSIGFFST